MRGTLESNIGANEADTTTVDPKLRIFEPSTPRRTRAILWLRQPRRRSTWAASDEMLGRDGDALTDEKETRIAASSQGSHVDSDKLLRGGTRTPGGSKNPQKNKSLSPNPGAFRRRLRPPRSRSRSGSVGSLSRIIGGGSSGEGPLADLVPVDFTRSFKPDLATDADSGDDDTPDPGHVLNSSSEWSSSGMEAGGEKKSSRGMFGIIKRRFKGKTVGASGSMTIGRATLASGPRGGLLSPPGSDYYEGVGTHEFPKRSASPARNIPVEWSSSIPSTAALTPSEASSGGLSPLPSKRLNQQQQQQQHLRLQSSPETSSSMVRGVSAPPGTSEYTSQSPLGHLDRVGQRQSRRRQSFTVDLDAMVREISAPGANPDFASSILSEDQNWVMQQPQEHQQEVDVASYSSGLGQADGTEVNGRGRSKVSGEKGGRRGSLSPARRLMAAAVAAASAAVSASIAKEQDKVESPKKGGGGSLSGGNSPERASMKQLEMSEAGAMSEGTPSERRGSVQSLQGYDCVVNAAPPSTVKYGDRLRLWAKSLPLDSGSISLGSGYVGSLDKVTRVHQRLFRRSESAVINLSGGTVSGFIDCHFKVVDPEGKREVGDVVSLGDAVLLVDDRGFVWSYSTKGSATPIRMKLRDPAKHHIAVCFRPAHGGSPDAPKDNIPIVFGPDELMIVPVSQGIKDSKRRRMASRKNYPLTAFSKKPSPGSSKSSMAKLSADGGGERMVFVLHLPNASPAGDPSPVIIKVIINANELERQKQQQQQQQHHHHRRRSSIVSLQGHRSQASSVHMPGGEGIEYRPNLSGGSVYAVKEDSVNTPSMSELQHEREDSSRNSGYYSGYSSHSHVTGGSGSSRDIDVGVSQELSLSSEGLQKGVLSPCRSHLGAEGEEEEEDEEDDDYDEEDGVEIEGNDRFGSIEGLKWGDFVQFKLPREDEVSPEDAMVTLDLSNGCSASVTSKQLRQNSGRIRFPVSAKRVNARGASSEDANTGCGGTVYLRCTLSPIVLCDGDEKVDAMATAAAATLQQKIAGVAYTGGNGFVETHVKAFTYRARRTSFRRKSAIIVFLASAVVIFSTTTKMPTVAEVKSSPTLSTMTEKVEIPEATDVAAPSQCSMACTSVWDLRRPDGTPYLHEQLLAAAAILGEEPLLGDGLKGNRSHGEARGGIGRGEGWARLCSIVFAMLASGFLVIDRLFGSGMGDDMRHEPSLSMPAPPMQAKVHLLEWDGRSMTEEETIAEEQAASSDIELIYYPTPSGSELLPMPHRFALAENMDMAKAWQRWGATLAWRKENNVDFLLSKPHPRYSLIKSMYPHCFHLPDKDGRLTYYERPGMYDINQLKKAGITKQDLVDHYVYCMEYLWQELQPKQSQKLTIVIDLEGVGMRDLAGESVGFLKTTVGIMSRHFPQRSFKIFILNAPSFFNMVFSVVKPLLNEATKKKIEVLPPAVASSGLLKVIPAESLPPNYGGTCQVPLMKSPAEASLLAHVKKMLEKNEEKMEPIS